MKTTTGLAVHKKLLVSLCSALFLLSGLPDIASADQYFDYGMKLFQQRNYKAAAQYFDIRLKSNPNDSYAQYYRGVCYHVERDTDKARALYEAVIASGSDANIRALAQKQLKIIESVSGAANSATALSKSPGGSGGKNPAASPGLSGPDATTNDAIGASGPTIVPPNARAYFTLSPGQNDIIVEGKINGRGINFKFDTGAHGIFLGKNHLRQLGIPAPTTKATGKATGVGGDVETWTVNALVTVGGITKKQSMMVSEEFESNPLLGQTFFEDLEYEIDNKGHCIYFRQPQALNAGDRTDQYSIPFHLKGKHLVVALEGPKGKKTDILVDTGAYSVLFSKRNLTDLNLDIPADAEQVTYTGVGGNSTGQKFMVDELRLGPIIMRHIPVILDTGEKGAVGKEDAREGLLGQEFFSSWRFAVDNKNQRLRFFH